MSNENSLYLSQEAVYVKSTEAAAITKLLEVLMLKGCIDAMGYQKKIAEK